MYQNKAFTKMAAARQVNYLRYQMYMVGDDLRVLFSSNVKAKHMA
jgi:hypothetical protein